MERNWLSFMGVGIDFKVVIPHFRQIRYAKGPNAKERVVLNRD
jgi:hypothetical protein